MSKRAAQLPDELPLHRFRRRLLGLCAPLLLFAATTSCSAPPAPKPAPVSAPPPLYVPVVKTPCEQATDLRDSVLTLLAEGRLDRTIRTIERADRLCPADAPTTWATLVIALADVGRFAEARALIAKIELHKDAPLDARATATVVKQKIDKYELPPADVIAARETSRRLAFEAQDAAAKGLHAIARTKYIAAWEAFHPNGAVLTGAGFAALHASDRADAQRFFDRAVIDHEKTTGGHLELDVPNGFGGFVDAIAWGASGRLIAVAHRTNVSVIDAITLRERVRLRGHLQTVTSVAFASDGRTIATGSRDGTVRVWDVASGHELHKLEGHTGEVLAVAIGPDAHLLASGGADKVVRVWNLATGDTHATLTGHEAAVTALSFAADSKTIASSSADRRAIVWELATSSAKLTIPAQATPLRTVSLGNAIAVGGEDGSLRVFNAKGDLSKALDGHGGAVTAVAFSPNNARLATASLDASVHVFDPASGALLRTLEGHSVFALALSWSPDGKLLASSGFNTVHLWDASSYAEVGRLSGHAQSVTALAWAPDGHSLAIGSQDRTVRVFGREVQALHGHQAPVTALSWSTQGTLASGSIDGTIRRWNLASASSSAPLEDVGSVQGIQWSPDGKSIAVVSPNKSLKVLDPGAAVTVGGDGTGPGAYAVAHSPDGKRVVFAAIGKVAVVRDLSGGKELARLSGHTGSVNSVAWSSDGTTIVSASSDKTVRVWDATTYALRTVIDVGQPVQVVATRPFAGGGVAIAAGATDGSLFLYKASGGPALMRATAHLDGILALAFSPDGAFLASGSRDGTTQLFSMPDAQLRLSLRAVAGSDAAYVFTPTGEIELFGEAREYPVCRVGALSVPFELCEERFSERGLLARTLP
jgi:WD40 repeat protein